MCWSVMRGFGRVRLRFGMGSGDMLGMGVCLMYEGGGVRTADEGLDAGTRMMFVYRDISGIGYASVSSSTSTTS